MLIDLHCHSNPRSACSALAPEELVEAARARGLDAVCLTEHDRFWQQAELDELAGRTAFPVFSGVELTTDMGHVLAFGLDSPGGALALASEVARCAATSGAVLYLAHPARDGLLTVSRETVEYFASVEAVNGSDSRLQNLAASGLAGGFPLPGIGGSDCHTFDEVGRAATEFERAVATGRELVVELRAGRYRPVHLPG